MGHSIDSYVSKERVPVTKGELAAEVIEMGQTLFDILLESAEACDTTEKRVTMDLVDARHAADEFFVALRLLLGLDG